MAKERGEDFQLILLRYAHERLLCRLAASRHARAFVLKGVALFTVWTGHPHRATRDLDFLGFGEASEERLRAVFAGVAQVAVPDDGVSFDADHIDVSPIRDGQEYGGVRVHLTARIATAAIRLQVDVGFGDAITPGAIEVEFPLLRHHVSQFHRPDPRHGRVWHLHAPFAASGLAFSPSAPACAFDSAAPPRQATSASSMAHTITSAQACRAHPSRRAAIDSTFTMKSLRSVSISRAGMVSRGPRRRRPTATPRRRAFPRRAASARARSSPSRPSRGNSIVGERVEILYKPDDPQSARLNGFFSLWFGPAVFGGIGALFTSIGGAFTFVVVRRRRK